MKTHNKIQCKNTLKTIISLILFLCISTAFAQDLPAGFGDDVTDVPAAPIDNYILFGIIIAMAYGCYRIRKSFKKV